jgi:AraC-like DNA-binding protein
MGLTLARRLTDESVGELAAAIGVAHGAHGFTVLDASRVGSDGCDAVVLESLRTRVLAPLTESLGQGELRMVAAHGVGQLALLGAVELARPETLRIFPRLDLALAGCPWREDLITALHSELPPLGVGVVSRVRAQLGENPSLSLDEVAGRLGMPPRSLQRKLSEAATTFAGERSELRLELAACRLSKTRDKIELISIETGYHSVSHFNTLFRRRYGVTPRTFRVQPRSARQ